MRGVLCVVGKIEATNAGGLYEVHQKSRLNCQMHVYGARANGFTIRRLIDLHTLVAELSFFHIFCCAISLFESHN